MEAYSSQSSHPELKGFPVKVEKTELSERQSKVCESGSVKKETPPLVETERTKRMKLRHNDPDICDAQKEDIKLIANKGPSASKFRYGF